MLRKTVQEENGCAVTRHGGVQLESVGGDPSMGDGIHATRSCDRSA